jgi:hypothetical protein
MISQAICAILLVTATEAWFVDDVFCGQFSIP